MRGKRRAKMKILTVHNKYKIRGGEDESRESEDRLLLARGHEIRYVIYDNSTIGESGLVRVGMQATWARGPYEDLQSEIKAWRPDILDVHNFFPLASPAVHHAARRLGVPTVQTLHNYRLLCPGATFYRNGQVCEDCTRYPFPLPGVIHGCYRQSSLQSGSVALMIASHRLLRTWRETVSLFIAVSDFEKRKFVENGFTGSKISVKPNFVLSAGEPGPGGEDFLFVGRLSPEKGLDTLIRAMESNMVPARLNVVGDGPLMPVVQSAAERNSRIRYLGRRPQAEVLDMMAHARCVVFPSEWYETFGRVAAESFAKGTPVIASQIGAVAEIVDDGRTGFHFEPGNSQDLARVMAKACAEPRTLTEMRKEARREYEAKYTPERNYQMLIAAYEQAIANG